MILLEELAKKGLITEDQIPQIIKAATDKYDGDVDQVLASFNVSDEEVIDTKASLFNLPVKKIDPGTITPTTLKIIPEETAQTYHFVYL